MPLWPQANLTKASSGEHDNQPLIEEILQLRAEMAGLLGFDSYASVSTSEKMAQTTGSVMKQTEELRAKALPAAAAELETLRAFVRGPGTPVSPVAQAIIDGLATAGKWPCLSG